MYKFVDTMAGAGTGSTLLSLNTIFNGVNLDEALTDNNGSFTTLSVNGRGILPRRINITETPGNHGVREKGYTYDLREITVTYRLKDKTNEGFRDRFNRLNGLLLGSKKRLEFTDEAAFFIATLQDGDTPEEDSNDIVGTLVFLCSDPAKRKHTHTLTIPTTFQTFAIHGQESTPWTSKTTFTSAANQYILETNQGGKIILNYNFIAGDVLEIDYKKRKVTLNGNLLQTAISIYSHWFDLKPGQMQIRASQPTTLTYTERYY